MSRTYPRWVFNIDRPCPKCQEYNGVLALASQSLPEGMWCYTLEFSGEGGYTHAVTTGNVLIVVVNNWNIVGSSLCVSFAPNLRHHSVKLPSGYCGYGTCQNVERLACGSRFEPLVCLVSYGGGGSGSKQSSWGAQGAL